MPDFPLALKRINSPVISPFSPESIGALLGGFTRLDATVAWPTANVAHFIPFSVYNRLTIKMMAILNGATLNGNVDVGIYDAGGALLSSIGSTAQAGISVQQVFDITDVTLGPGLYYKAIAFDNNVGTLLTAALPVGDLRWSGMVQMASAFPLPNPATFATFAGAFVPILAASQRVTI